MKIQNNFIHFVNLKYLHVIEFVYQLQASSVTETGHRNLLLDPRHRNILPDSKPLLRGSAWDRSGIDGPGLGSGIDKPLDARSPSPVPDP